MKVGAEKRTFSRYCYETHILLFEEDRRKNASDRTHFQGRMIDYCMDGMCFESVNFFKPGRYVYIWVANTASNNDEQYITKVRWCNEITNADLSNFKIGVQYFQAQRLPAFGFGRRENTG